MERSEMGDTDHFEEEAALEAQQQLLESSLPLVFEAFDQARQQGMHSPVVFLLDCEDPIGNEIAQEWLGAEKVDEAVEQRQLAEQGDAEGQTTVFAYAFPWQDCQAEVPEVFPYLTPVFESDYPENGFLAIAVTWGGASALTVPLSAREK